MGVGMVVVSATRLRVRGIRFLPAFALATNRSRKQTAAAAGFRKGQLVIDHGRTSWTVTMWDDLESMRAYRDSGAHAAVLRRIADWCDEAATATWEQGSEQFPDMEELGQRMVEAARFVKLPHASRAHLAGSGPMPPRPRAVQPIQRRG
ncbi:MAG TPA: DUF3291 domain-containing protein [Candidatus Thermoplasmatota archaeon]|nr:DUF3291 domain-containing protein [Candidatus Thermoplasmatota archaeon]